MDIGEDGIYSLGRYSQDSKMKKRKGIHGLSTQKQIEQLESQDKIALRVQKTNF